MADVSDSFLDRFDQEDDPDGVGTTVVEERSGEKSGPPRKRSPLTLLGIGLMVAGLACLGWVGFQYFGTNVVSEQVFQTETEQLRTKWQDQDRTDPKGRDQASTVPGDAMALLRIPAFGDDYEIPILNGTDLSILSKGVGHYASTAAPGQIGNFAIAGHRVTHGQPFAKLLSLKKGDEVIVETREAIYTYVMDDSPRQLTVDDSETWVLDPVPGKAGVKPTEAMITLTTCQDLFRSPDRSIGFGRLQSTQNK
jgi:sortase A